MIENFIETDEFAPGEIIGDYKLFDHCAVGDISTHKYKFQIDLTVEWINTMVEAFKLNPKDIEFLSHYNAVVADQFVREAFIKNYGHDSRTDFLNHQFENTAYKKQFLKRVKNLLALKNDFFPISNSSYIKDQEVLHWLNAKEQQIAKGQVKLGLSHRLHALIFYYKAEAGDAPKVFPRKQIIEKYGKARERAIDKIWHPKRFNENKPTMEELIAILPWLKSFNAQKAYAFVEDLIGKHNAERYPVKPK